MADRSVASTNTLEQFRTTFNSLATDLGDISSVTGASGVIASATDVVEAVVQLNTKVNTIVSGSSVFSGNLIFEGSTDDSFETTLAITDPTADRTITLPNLSGTISLTSASETLTNKTITSPVVSGLTLSDSSIVFEGSTADSFETTFAITDPTADRTITFPNLTGTVSLLTATETLTNKTLTSPTLNSPAINSPTIIFEGSTADSFETTIAVTDPTADRTITLPNVTGTILTTGNSDSPATTTSSSDVDFLLIDDGGTMKKITTANVGLATNAFAIAQAVALG